MLPKQKRVERLFWATADLRCIPLFLPVHFRLSELLINKLKKAISV